MSTPEFLEFPKMGRLSRDCMISEKIDGTNAQIYITDEGEFLIGSRTRWITPESDNFGFARWATEHKDELMTLGAGQHFGEWWGSGIQRTYGLKEKRFSLFNTGRWIKDESFRTDEKQEVVPVCCNVVPILYQGIFDTNQIHHTLFNLAQNGSQASQGFMNPEGIVIYHIAAKAMFKKTIKDDEVPKSLVKK